jgi:hypothetical protein
VGSAFALPLRLSHEKRESLFFVSPALLPPAGGSASERGATLTKGKDLLSILACHTAT